MKSSSFFQDIIDSIVSPRRRLGGNDVKRPVEDLCHELLSSRGEVSGKRIGAAILNAFEDMPEEEKISFFTFLTEELDLDAEVVETAAAQYGGNKSPDNLEFLLKACEPPRQELLRRLNQLPGATQSLVSMRAHLLRLMPETPSLRRLDLDFQHLLASWFNRGFLDLRPISWETPANILAKIIQYEAVHAINGWNDLRRRLQPRDRRCFAFFHPSMPDEPLVFVEIALCEGIPNSVQDVLVEHRDVLHEEAADTAVFYSISNCQAGLRGISFGNSLIKQVATDLSAQLPNLKNFVTLSPLPGFARWALSDAAEMPDGLQAHLADLQEKALSEDTSDLLMPFATELKTLAARYLLMAKRDDGLPLDPVARFHLGNGASVHQLHAGADTSQKGISQSFCVMVNYAYDMAETESRHEEFVTHAKVHASRAVRSLSTGKINFTQAVAEDQNEQSSV